jgi:predicted dehydrogenase
VDDQNQQPRASLCIGPNQLDRRSIIQTSGLALAAAALPKSIVHSQESSDLKVRVGIIGRTGKGDYGHGIDVAFTKIPQVKIVAVADDNDGGREQARKRLGVTEAFSDYRQMLATFELDLVAICPRWIDQHHEMILAAASAGCHVYMEKPFCRTLRECDEAIAAMERSKRKIGIAHISQYSPVLDPVITLIKKGEIGDVLEIRARGKEDRRGGGEDLWVLGSHVLGIMRTIANADPTSCTAIVQNQGHRSQKADIVNGAEGIGRLIGDHVQATYRFPNGIVGYFASKRNAASPLSRFAVQVFGSKGIIEIESGYLAKAYILRDGSWSPGRSTKNWEVITSAGIGVPEPRRDGTYEGGHIAAILDLIECTKQGRRPKCSAYDGRSITEMIVSVFESHRRKAEVAFPLETRDDPLSLLTD